MRYLLYIFIIFITLASEYIYSKPTVNWYVAEEPPISYTYKDTIIGYGIDIIKKIQDHLPEYQHKIIMAGNYNRLTTEVSRNTLSIGLGLFKTAERERFMEFTNLPIFYFYNIHIAMGRETFIELGKPHHISLKQIIDSNRRVGVSKGRTYSEDIRKIIETEGSNVYRGSQGNVSESLLLMLDNGRIEYTLLYPEEASYLAKKHRLKGRVVTVPIKETEDISFSWLGIHKDDQGKMITKKIDKILETIQTDEYPSYYLEWISKNNHDDYRNEFRRFNREFREGVR